jgi:plasmid stabilization system protein ParE
MIFKIIVVPIVEKEFEEIFEWYKERSLQASDNFFDEFYKAIDEIKTEPFHYRNTEKEYREIKLRKYPYYIIYRVNEDAKIVVIVRLYHTSRNPENKFRNLD